MRIVLKFLDGSCRVFHADLSDIELHEQIHYSRINEKSPFLELVVNHKKKEKTHERKRQNKRP